MLNAQSKQIIEVVEDILMLQLMLTLLLVQFLNHSLIRHTPLWIYRLSLIPLLLQVDIFVEFAEIKGDSFFL